MADNDQPPSKEAGESPLAIRRVLGENKAFRDLGVTQMARALGLNDDQTNGHWCSRFDGIWFGFTLEVECPVCGNRWG